MDYWHFNYLKSQLKGGSSRGHPDGVSTRLYLTPLKVRFWFDSKLAQPDSLLFLWFQSWMVLCPFMLDMCWCQSMFKWMDFWFAAKISPFWTVEWIWCDEAWQINWNRDCFNFVVCFIQCSVTNSDWVRNTIESLRFFWTLSLKKNDARLDNRKSSRQRKTIHYMF